MNQTVNSIRPRRMWIVLAILTVAAICFGGFTAIAATTHVIFSVNGDTTATSMTQGDNLAWGADCAVGATLFWEIWYDLNNNDVINDPGDVLVATFTIADGQIDSNDGPPDTNPTPDGFYLSTEMELGIAPGQYIFRVTDQSDASTASNSINCNPMPSPPNTFVGRVVIAGHPAPDPLLQWIWIEANNDNGQMWSAFTNDSGYFTINVGASGTGLEFHIEPKAISGYVPPADRFETASGVVNLTDFVYATPSDSVFGTVRDENGDPLPMEVWVYANQNGVGSSKNTQTVGGDYAMYFSSGELGEWWIGVSQDALIPAYVVPSGYSIDNSSTHGLQRNFVCRTADTVFHVRLTENGGLPAHPYKLIAQLGSDNSFTLATSGTGSDNLATMHISSTVPSDWTVSVVTWDTMYPVPDGFIHNGTWPNSLGAGDTATINFIHGHLVRDTIFVDPDDDLPNPDSVHVQLWNSGGNYNGTVDGNGVFSVYSDTGMFHLSVWCNGYMSIPMNRSIHVTGDTAGGLSVNMNKLHARIYGTLQNVELPLPPFTFVNLFGGGVGLSVTVDQQTGAWTCDAFDADWTVTPPTLPNRTTPTPILFTLGEMPDSVHEVTFSYSLVSGVEEPQDEQLPTAFALGQNYPNPFNPSTAIEFALPHKSEVKLTVYNLLGQAIVTLVNGELPAGNHSAVWNGHDAIGREVSSGVYFYKLTAGTFIETKKMVYLK